MNKKIIMRTGLYNVDPQEQFNKALVLSALHEIMRHTIRQVAILMSHHINAQCVYNRDIGISIPEDEEGNYAPYTQEEEKSIKDDLINIVVKFHAIDEEGLGSKLTPLIVAVYNERKLPQNILSSEFIQTVITGVNNYTNIMDTNKAIDEMLNIKEECEDIVDLETSFPNDYFPVAIYEDNYVQCACEFCEGFFQVQEKKYDYNSLNFIQRAMIDNILK